MGPIPARPNPPNFAPQFGVPSTPTFILAGGTAIAHAVNGGRLDERNETVRTRRGLSQLLHGWVRASPSIQTSGRARQMLDSLVHFNFFLTRVDALTCPFVVRDRGVIWFVSRFDVRRVRWAIV